MTMPGGGFFKLAPGQVTDDSEQAMCLLWAILKSNKNVIDKNKLALMNYPDNLKAGAIGENRKEVQLDPEQLALHY